MIFILPALPFSNATQVDPDFEQTRDEAVKAGLAVGLLDYEDLLDGNIIQAIRKLPANDLDEPVIAVLRGWMITSNCYAQLYEKLLEKKNIRLINSPGQYRICHELPGWYEALQDITPESLILTGLSPANESTVTIIQERFPGCAVLVKDFVKSRKHEWLDACYVPDTDDGENLLRVVTNFIQRQGDDITGGLVVRRFQNMKLTGVHPQTQMPLPYEWRVFRIRRDKTVIVPYWIAELTEANGADFIDPPSSALARILSIVDTLDTDFCAVDIALTDDGQLIVIEIGDGQVSDIRDERKLSELVKSFGS